MLIAYMHTIMGVAIQILGVMVSGGCITFLLEL